MQRQSTDRIARLERTLWAMYRDGSVRGVMWSPEVVSALYEMQADQIQVRAEAVTHQPTSSELGHG